MARTMLIMVMLMCCLMGFVVGISSRQMKIALHAQLFPSVDKVVGSVITTEGLKAAFATRNDVEHVEVFYPSHYVQYLNHSWDLVLIEGWFPSIISFIQLTRNNFPQATIIFICLDPAYPGKTQVANFDVDAILTNSESLLDFFKDRIPVEHMMLAADPTVMRPFPNITREWGAIYIGAGGHMLQVKPELHMLLSQALPYRLRLHGSSWDTVPEFRSVTMGTLPQWELAQAYASAHVVLASTIQSQSQHGMVNNRIFEALACGALVVSKWAPELAALQCPALLLIEGDQSLTNYMDAILGGDQEVVAGLRKAGRECILQQHTWGHRAVQIIDFYHYLKSGEIVPPPPASAIRSTSDTTVAVCANVRCTRPNCPKLLWLVGDHLQHHSDYVFVARTIGRRHLCSMFDVHVETYTDFLFDSIAPDLPTYEVLLAFITPFDALDVAMRHLGPVHLPAAEMDLGGPRVQKRGCYVIGCDPALVLSFVDQVSQEISAEEVSLQHYDAVWYRSTYEMQLLANLGVTLPAPSRMQLMFGVGAHIEPAAGGEAAQPTSGSAGALDAAKTERARVVIVCFFHHAQQCGRAARELYARKVRIDYLGDAAQDALSVDVVADDTPTYTLLCLGGQWKDWLRFVDRIDGQPLLSHRDLPAVVHVRDGWAGDAVRILQSAEVAVIMNPPGPSSRPECTAAPMDSTSSSAADNLHQVRETLREALQCQLRDQQVAGATTDEVLWPLVAAALSYTRIHLLSRSAQLMDLVAGGECGSWSEEYMVTSMVKVGVNRLLGLGSRHSAISPRLLQAQLVATDSAGVYEVRCEALSESSQCHSELSLLQSFVANHELPAPGGDTAAVHFALVELWYDEFVSGRDGEACIQQPGVPVTQPGDMQDPAWKAADGNRPGDKVCLMRPYKYVAVVLSNGLDSEARAGTQDNTCKTAVDLSFQLRGNFFGDSFSFAELSVSTVNTATLLPVPRKWSTAWLEKNSVFVYNALYC